MHDSTNKQTKPKILVADSDEDNRKLFYVSLKDEYEVIAVENWFDVFEKTEIHKPDLIFLEKIVGEEDILGLLTNLRKRQMQK